MLHRSAARPVSMALGRNAALAIKPSDIITDSLFIVRICPKIADFLQPLSAAALSQFLDALRPVLGALVFLFSHFPRIDASDRQAKNVHVLRSTRWREHER